VRTPKCRNAGLARPPGGTTIPGMEDGTERAERYRYRDYLSWPEGERVELIEGVPYAMSPAPRREHQRLVSELNRQLANALHDAPCEVYPAPFDVKLSREEEDERPTVVQPDLTVVCDPAKLTEQGVTGAPDLVVEIVSPRQRIPRSGLVGSCASCSTMHPGPQVRPVPRRRGAGVLDRRSRRTRCRSIPVGL
jgi:hypothetical protein